MQPKPPSDFARTEWVTYIDGNPKQLRQDFGKAIDSVVELASFYERLGVIAAEAEDIDPELAFERYKQALLITGSVQVKRKLKSLLTRLNNKSNEINFNEIPKRRLQWSLHEFYGLLP